MEKYIFRKVSAERGWHYYKRACSLLISYTHTHTHTHISPSGSRPRHALLGNMSCICTQHTYVHTYADCTPYSLQWGSKINSCFADCSAQLKLLYTSHTLGGPFFIHTHFNSPPQYPGTNYNYSTEGLYVWYPFVCVCPLYPCHITNMEAYH